MDGGDHHRRARRAQLHTAVWTGSEMIVWGGADGGSGYLNDGGRYNPAANSWTAVSTTGAPAARYSHTAVWTGSEMIVWGGYNDGTYFERRRALQSGGQQLDGGDHHRRRAPAQRSHGGVDGQRDDRLGRIRQQQRFERRRALQSGGQQLDGGHQHHGAPAARYGHTAVWTGSEMIVWGGAVAAAI